MDLSRNKIKIIFKIEAFGSHSFSIKDGNEWMASWKVTV